MPGVSIVTRRRILYAALVALAVAVAVATATALRPAAPQDARPHGSLSGPLAPAASDPPRSPALLTPVPVSVPVAFVGDGLTSPAPAGTAGDWAARTAVTLAAGGEPITVLSASSRGAGFATPSAGGLTIAQLVDRAVGRGVRVVVIFGGWGDRTQTAAAVQAGAQAAIAEVHRLAPTATVLLVAPPTAPGLPVPRSTTEGLRQAALSGTAALAPTGDGWSLDRGMTSGTSDGVPVLTPAGQAAIAARVGPDLAPLVSAARQTL